MDNFSKYLLEEIARINKEWKDDSCRSSAISVLTAVATTYQSMKEIGAL